MLERLEQQNRLTLNQWKIVTASILGDMLDFFDFFLIGYVLVFIITQWKLTFIQSGIILLAAGVGSIPGAFFWGWMADRIGPQFFARHRHYGSDARPVWLGVSGVLPDAGRGRPGRDGRRRSAARAGIRSVVETRLCRRSGHKHGLGRRRAGRIVRNLSRTGDRLARPISDRAVAGGVDVADPR